MNHRSISTNPPTRKPILPPSQTAYIYLDVLAGLGNFSLQLISSLYQSLVNVSKEDNDLRVSTPLQHVQRPFAPNLLHALAAAFLDPSPFSLSDRACVVDFAPHINPLKIDMSQKVYCRLWRKDIEKKHVSTKQPSSRPTHAADGGRTAPTNARHVTRLKGARDHVIHEAICEREQVYGQRLIGVPPSLSLGVQ